MARTIYVVKANDTLTSIAKKFNTTVKALVELNHIQNPNLIYVGQSLIISGEPEKISENGKTVTITAFGLLVNESRKIFVTWEWTKEGTDHYEVEWDCYYPDRKQWFKSGGKKETLTDKESVFEAPSEVDAVRVKITPIAETKTVNGKEVAKWTGSPTSYERLTYWLNNEPPAKPSSAPTVSVDGDKLTATVTNLNDLDADGITFEVVKDHEKSVFTTNVTIVKDRATWNWTVDRGATYKVRFRGYRGQLCGDWSDYSSDVYSLPTIPSILENGITVLTKNSIMLTFHRVKNAKAYKIQYISSKDVVESGFTPEEYFNSGNAQIYTAEYTDSSNDGTGTVTWGLNLQATGDKFYIRIGATSNNVSSSSKQEWSDIREFSVGTKPTAPTTWSLITTALVGESMKLYWCHNSEDGSIQTKACLKIKYNGGEKVFNIDDTANAGNGWTPNDGGIINYVRRNDMEDVNDKTYVCDINTSHETFVDGAKVEWCVSTSGVTDELGVDSAWRTFNIYKEATMTISLEDSSGHALPNDNSLYQRLTTFPLCIRANINQTTNQNPISYNITIVSNQNEVYTTVDETGTNKVVVKGTQVYSRYFDSRNEEMFDKELFVTLSANHVDLKNDITYLITCTASMDSGLEVSQSAEFMVSWIEESFTPQATISVDPDSLAAYIQPFSDTEDDVLLSVYRREFDGSFVEIETDITNDHSTYITDPHPSLDYARYRIVARSKTTGAISYNDLPAYPVNERSVVIQWDDDWHNFASANGDVGEMVEQPWVGSMLKLPYNINVTESNNPDVSLVEYIGRKQPVSYYGTQLRSSLSISVDIDKADKETVYALRRLSVWMGNVYVREPTGIGYWANIKVSFTQTHSELKIPVTLNISRVEGGK